MSTLDKSMALTGQPPASLSLPQKLAVALGMAGLGIMLLAAFNINFPQQGLWLSVSLLALFTGITWFSWEAYKNKQPGIKNDGVWFKSVSSRGLCGWVAGIDRILHRLIFLNTLVWLVMVTIKVLLLCLIP